MGIPFGADCHAHPILGILDQNDGTLIVFDDVAVDKTYELALDTIHAMGKVVDSLYQKAKKLT